MYHTLFPCIRFPTRRLPQLIILQTRPGSRSCSNSLSRASIPSTKLDKPPPPTLTSPSFSTPPLTMAKAKAGFYAVKVGRKTGVFTSWDECLAQVKGHPGALYQKFTTPAEAQQFAFPGSSAPPPPPAASTTSSKVATASTSSISSRSPATSLKRSSSSASSSASAKKKPKAATTWSHTASSVTPSTFDPKDRYWRTSSGRIVVYTDGSSLGNGKSSAKAGAGVFWGEGNERNVSERVPGSVQTNNRGELLAIIRAIETAPDSTTPLEIRTDSQYCIKSLTEWLPGWRKKGFKTATGSGVVNVDLIQHLATLIDLRRGSTSSIHATSLPSKTFDSDSEGDDGPVDFILEVDGAGKGKRTGGIKFVHVKAHAGLDGNEAADTLANEGALRPIPVDRQFGLKLATLSSSSSIKPKPTVVPRRAAAVKKGTTTTKKKTSTDKRSSSHSEGDDDYDEGDSEFWGDAIKATEEVEAKIGSSQAQR